jgi:Glycosyl hydrolase family 1
MRRGVGAVFIAALALAAAAPAGASPGAQYGIQDDAWLMDGPGTLAERVTTLQGLGVGIVRFTIRWDAVAPTEPARERDPNDSAYHWGAYGDVLDTLHARGIPVLVTLWGSPRWANGGGAPNRLPVSGVGNFAAAAAVRFPWVRLWTAWNEPNNRTFASPVSPRLYVSRVLNPAYAALHAASGANRVAGGVTSPRKAPSGMAPLAFMQGMRAAHAHLDAYAQNPYPVGRGETPTRPTCQACFTMASLPAIRADVTRYFGAKPLWLTEYGYQTNPPDRLLGVSYALQATYLSEAALRVWRQPGVTLLIHFLVRDEPSLGGWQSGLFRADGSAKLAYHAFALPLAQVSRHGSSTVLWGQVRPGSGVRTYVLQRSVAGRWRAVGPTARTARNGAFTRRANLPAGARVRIFAPSVGWTGPPLSIS